MLKIFFNRSSPIVFIMENFGLAALILKLFFHIGGTISGALTKTILSAMIIEYVFIKACSLKKWYAGFPRIFGIGLHFSKSMVPTSYIMAMVGIIVLFGKGVFIISFVSFFLLAAIAHINVIFIYFWFRDSDITPPNFYSKRLFTTPSSR